MKKKRILFIVLSLAVFITAYFTLLKKPKRLAKKKNVYNIKIMDPIEANNLHIPVAAELGFFEEEGIEANISNTSAGKFAMDALNAGGVNYAIVVEMNVAHTLFRSDDIAILAELAEPINAIKILGRRDHGITTSHDLVGKKIGVLYGVNIHLFLLKYLKEQGISEDQVELINLKPPDAVAAFVAGDLDAVITWQPHVYRLQQKLRDKLLILTDNDLAYWTYKMILVTKKSYLETHKEEAKKVLKALIRADEFIQKKPQQAQKILANVLHLDTTAVHSFFDEIHFEVQISSKLLTMIKTEVEWLEKGLLKGKKAVTYDFRSLIADELSIVKPASFKIK